MKFRTAYPDAPERIGAFNCVGISRTRQSEKAACDINNIVSRYIKTEVMEHINAHRGVFADLPPQLEYQDALSQVKVAEGAFSMLPAEVRAQFANDPYKFLAFADANEDYLVKLGLERAAPVDPPADVPPANPPAPPQT